jgi:hypothetical protein
MIGLLAGRNERQKRTPRAIFPEACEWALRSLYRRLGFGSKHRKQHTMTCQFFGGSLTADDTDEGRIDPKSVILIVV